MSLTNLNTRLDKWDRPRRADNKLKKVISRLLILLLLLVVFIYLPLRVTYSSVKSLSADSKVFTDSLKSQNLLLLKSSLKSMQTDSDSINHSLVFLIWLQAIPLLGGYYGDARHFAAALSDELSAFNTLSSSLSQDSLNAPDKLSQIVKILSQSLPSMDKATPALKQANDEVSGVDTNKYPEYIGKYRLRADLTSAKNLIIGSYLAVGKYRSALQIAPSLLGDPQSKNYLILFQNDKELRATGGFLTAFSFINIDHGHVSTTASDDIYRLDEQLLKVCQAKVCPGLTPPAPIVKYLPEADGRPRGAWSLRDSNLSPDLPTSMRSFEGMYQLLGGGLPFDGIVTIDTEVVRSMIDITGPVDVYGTSYSAEVDKRCNCPNVVYQLEDYSEIVAKGQVDRKAILGTLMQQILHKALNTSTENLPQFITALANLAGGKHMMFYMHDEGAEKALSELGWTGQIIASSGDYLHINDSNFAGGKSNLYVTEDVSLDIDTHRNVHKLVINYSNPQPYSSWLNAINRDYIRVYVPFGSKLISSNGSDVGVTTIDQELGKSVFEAFIQTRPQNSRVLEFDYTTPKYSTPYPILIQKQPGTKDFHYTIKIDGQTKESLNLSSDQALSL